MSQFITSVSFKKPRFYDLQLDHWGISAEEGESFLVMKDRIDTTVRQWWNGRPSEALVPHNGFYDNSISGVKWLNDFASSPSTKTFYFTISFDATVQFPDQTLTKEDLASFPSPLPAITLHNPLLDLLTQAGAGLISIGSKLPGVPNIVDLAKWGVKVANNHLGALGYFNRIPLPGSKVPRSDMLPILLVTSLGMGGYEGNAPPGISAVEYQPNDGIVNTRSMRGPSERWITDASALSLALLAEGGGKGRYWHLGINKTMDHADEIGVFTVGETVS